MAFSEENGEKKWQRAAAQRKLTLHAWPLVSSNSTALLLSPKKPISKLSPEPKNSALGCVLQSSDLVTITEKQTFPC